MKKFKDINVGQKFFDQFGYTYMKLEDKEFDIPIEYSTYKVENDELMSVGFTAVNLTNGKLARIRDDDEYETDFSKLVSHGRRFE